MTDRGNEITASLRLIELQLFTLKLPSLISNINDGAWADIVRETVNARGKDSQLSGESAREHLAHHYHPNEFGLRGHVLISFAFLFLSLSFFSLGELNSITRSFFAMSVHKYVWKDAE